MKIVFMGTPEFAVPCLKALCESGEDVAAVFTMPDKPKGRGLKLTPPPIKEYALEKGIPVYQPKSLKKGDDAEDAYEALKKLEPELIVVVAYGNILPKRILEIPAAYCINIHASLLPKYRGASPMQTCILRGESVTGVTSMIMEEGLDSGDMIFKEQLEIGENETAAELHDRLSELGSRVLLKTVSAIKSGDIPREKQRDELSCYAPMLTKDMCPIDFNKPACEVHRQVRGLSDWPCAEALVNGKKLKIYHSRLEGRHYDLPAGTLCNEKNFTVVCGDGMGIVFTEIQAQGGKRMKSEDYLRGNRLEKNAMLGN